MHDIAHIFHDFPGPLLFSMTFEAWKLVCLNSMTFHDFPGPVVTLNYIKTFQLVFKLSVAQVLHQQSQWEPVPLKYGCACFTGNFGYLVEKPTPLCHCHMIPVQPVAIGPHKLRHNNWSYNLE